MSAHIYIEGAESKSDQIRCREGFRRLLEKAGFSGQMPRLSACGGRGDTFHDFSTAHLSAKTGDYIAMLVDSEDPVEDIEQTWEHLAARDHWSRPVDATDEQVLFMTTCMETVIVADRATLRKHYGSELQESALPAISGLETRDRHEIQDALIHATRSCSNAYAKGRRSFIVVGELAPSVLEQHLPSFHRMLRILHQRL